MSSILLGNYELITSLFAFFFFFFKSKVTLAAFTVCEFVGETSTLLVVCDVGDERAKKFQNILGRSFSQRCNRARIVFSLRLQSVLKVG